MDSEKITDNELLRINPEKKPLTVETLRTFEGLENLPHEEAQEMVFSIRTFCFILLEAVKQSEKQPIMKSMESNNNQPASAETLAGKLKQAA